MAGKTNAIAFSESIRHVTYLFQVDPCSGHRQSRIRITAQDVREGLKQSVLTLVQGAEGADQNDMSWRAQACFRNKVRADDSCRGQVDAGVVGVEKCTLGRISAL